MCGYEAPFFGASYPDGICIDGYMWDLDSCDEPGGALTSGGSVPCPSCNAVSYLNDAKEEAETTISSWSWPGSGSRSGVDIWQCAAAFVSSIHGASASDIIKEIGPVDALDNDGKVTVLIPATSKEAE